jgi:hypothetical protein
MLLFAQPGSCCIRSKSCSCVGRALDTVLCTAASSTCHSLIHCWQQRVFECWCYHASVGLAVLLVLFAMKSVDAAFAVVAWRLVFHFVIVFIRGARCRADIALKQSASAVTLCS